MIKLQEYLKAKELVKVLEEREVKLRNEIYRAEQDAERTADPLREAWLNAKEEAVRRARISVGSKIVEHQQVRNDLHDAQRKFGEMHYDCNHRDENGALSLQFSGGFGYERGDKIPLRCLICGEEWK